MSHSLLWFPAQHVMNANQEVLSMLVAAAELPFQVKVASTVMGPRFVTVFPPSEPPKEPTFPQQLIGFKGHRATRGNPTSLSDYIQTRLDKE